MNKKQWMFLSLWADHDGAPGMGLFSVDTATGELEFCKQLNDEVSFACSHYDSQRGILYVCNEEAKSEHVGFVQYKTGRIYGYKVSPVDGSLTELFCRETYSPNPAYLSLDSSGKYMVVVNYGSDDGIAKLHRKEDGRYDMEVVVPDSLLELFAVNPDGTLGELLDVKKHVLDREKYPRGSHLHCTVFSPSGNLFVVCDKGSGFVHVYTIDRENDTLKLLSSTQTSHPSLCPRHCVFHPSKPYFVMNHEKERNGSMVLSSFRYTEDGQVEEVSAVNVLPAGYEVPPKAHFELQGLCISEDGKYIYTSIKEGPNAIAVLSFDEMTGELRLLQHAPITGVWPRGLALVPGGKIIVSSCLVSGDIATYEIEENGLLRPTGSTAKLRGGAYMTFCEQG